MYFQLKGESTISISMWLEISGFPKSNERTVDYFVRHFDNNPRGDYLIKRKQNEKYTRITRKTFLRLEKQRNVFLFVN